MSLKLRFFNLILTFCFLSSLLIVGVFAIKNTNFTVGGNITFQTKGIEATIELTNNGLTDALLPEGSTAGVNVMNPIIINNSKTKDEINQQFSKWAGLDLIFAEAKSEASIEIRITNTTSDINNYIDITTTADAITKNNASINVVNNNG